MKKSKIIGAKGCFRGAMRLLLAGLPLAQSAVAISGGDTIAIDFGATVAGGNYNHVENETQNSNTWTVPADLVRLSDGAPTGVGFDVDVTTGGSGSIRDNANYVAGNGGNTADASVYADGITVWSAANTANEDTLTLTFSGLDDALSYTIIGGSARTASPGEFVTKWTINGTGKISDASVASGYVTFTNLLSSGGTLVITLTDEAHRVGVAQLELTAVGESAPFPLPNVPIQLTAANGYNNELVLDWADNEQDGFPIMS